MLTINQTVVLDYKQQLKTRGLYIYYCNVTKSMGSVLSVYKNDSTRFTQGPEFDHDCAVLEYCICVTSEDCHETKLLVGSKHILGCTANRS